MILVNHLLVLVRRVAAKVFPLHADNKAAVNIPFPLHADNKAGEWQQSRTKNETTLN